LIDIKICYIVDLLPWELPHQLIIDQSWPSFDLIRQDFPTLAVNMAGIHLLYDKKLSKEAETFQCLLCTC
jgi:hypothetical protein